MVLRLAYFMASISKKLLNHKISKWSVDRKFNSGGIVNFQAPRPPANIRPKRIKQAGGSRKNFAAPASKKARPRAGFCGGPAPHTVKPGNISRPRGILPTRRDIPPMRHIIRASSPHELAHAVSCREAGFPAHGRNAATFFTPDARPAFTPDTVGRKGGAMSWGEPLTKEAS